MKKHIAHCISAILAGAPITMSVSAHAAPAAVPDTVRPGEVTVTAQRSPLRVSSSTPVQTISATTIEQLGIRDIADAVRRFAGTNVKDYGGVGGLKTVSVRNMGAAHTAVSYDGMAVSNCQAGQIDIGRFSLDNVGMLSLAVGQSDEMLQSARLYASAAVLGITTERPEFTAGRPYAFRASVSGGSFGYIAPSLRWWQRIGNRVRTSLEGSFLHTDGDYPFTLRNGKLVTKERRNNSEVNSWHGEANVFYTTPGGGELQLKGYYYYSKRGLPGAITLYNPISTEKLWDENAFVQATFRKRFSPQWSLLAQAKYNYGWNKDEETGPQYTGGLYRATHHQDEYYLSASATWTPLPDLTVALAQDGIVNKLNSTMVDCPQPTRYTSLTALSARWHYRPLTVTGTLVATVTDEKVETGDAPDNVHRVDPSLSMSLQPWANRQFFVRLMYKNTFRMPSFNDLYYFRLGNRTLRPERADEYGIGLTWGESLFPAMRYLSVSADGYYNDVTDKIVAFPSTYAWRMANFGRVHAWGVDLSLATSIGLPADLSLTLSGSYTYQRAADVTDRKSKTYRHQLPYTPRHSGNLSAVVETPWVTLGYSVVFVGMRYYMDQNIPANEIEGYADQTISLSREFKLPHGIGLTLRGEVANLADKQYDVIKFYPMPGRSWRLTATVKI